MRECYVSETNSFVKVQPIGKREIFFNGELFDMRDYPLLDSEDQKCLDNLIDGFEEGGNNLVNFYNTDYEHCAKGEFSVSRKVKIVNNENSEKTQQMIETIKKDCRYFEEIKNKNMLLNNYLYLSECYNSDDTGLYQLILNGQELYYGTLNEINAIVKAMIKIEEIGFS